MKNITLILLFLCYVIFISCNNSTKQESSGEEVISERLTGKQIMENEGWEYIAYVRAFWDTPRSDMDSSPKSAGSYYIYQKDDKYVAIKSEHGKSSGEPTRFSVKEGYYYIQGESFNARISLYGTYAYFNL